MRFTWLLAAILAWSPTAMSTPPPDEPLPGGHALPPAPSEVLQIPAPLRDALQAQVIERTRAGEPRMRRLMQFMFEPEGLGLSYEPDANLTITEVWEARKANCLSFSMMVVALSRAAGLEAYAQEIPKTLAWYSEGDIAYFSNHVNAGIRIRDDRYTMDVASNSVLTTQPPERISDERLLAIFYSNRAADLIADNRLDDAATYIEAAMRSDARYATAWNNLGVLRLRQEQPVEAERNFLRAVELDKVNDGALANLASLYAKRGDTARAAQYNRHIERMRASNPFHHFQLGMIAEGAGDYDKAAGHYRKAIALYDREHRFYFGLARAYLHLGRARDAGEALKRAQQITTSGSMRERYQAKLDKLRQLQQ